MILSGTNRIDRKFIANNAHVAATQIDDFIKFDETTYIYSSLGGTSFITGH